MTPGKRVLSLLLALLATGSAMAAASPADRSAPPRASILTSIDDEIGDLGWVANRIALVDLETASGSQTPQKQSFPALPGARRADCCGEIESASLAPDAPPHSRARAMPQHIRAQQGTAEATAVAEPETYTMLLIGLGLIGLSTRTATTEEKFEA